MTVLCLNIKTTNAGRNERIKKELQTKFKSLCQNEASATNLFGDDFQEAVKKLEGSKANLTSSAKHFLGKKRGGPPQQATQQQHITSKPVPELQATVQQASLSELRKETATIQKETPNFNKKVNEVGNFSFRLINTPSNFKAGKTKVFKENWYNITRDTWILNTIQGSKVELYSVPRQTHIPKPFKFGPDEQMKIKQEIGQFLECQIIEKAFTEDESEFILKHIYSTEKKKKKKKKKDGRTRIFLNLKTFNENYMDQFHFKMETLHSAISAMRKNCFFFGELILPKLFTQYRLGKRIENNYGFGMRDKNTNLHP